VTTALDVVAGRAAWVVEQGDVLERLAAMPSESVNCVVTSPPYWGLRDYGTATWTGGDPACDHLAVNRPRNDTTNGNTGGHFAVGSRGTQPAKEYRQQFRDACGKCGATSLDQQLGLELTPAAYVARMVEVFAGVRRVLRSDGCCWINLGDSYAGSWGAQSREGYAEVGQLEGGSMLSARQIAAHPKGQTGTGSLKNTPGLKNKDLVGIPWRVAFALQADGWWLRSDVIWAKPNPMPESVTDRPTRAHEYLFLLTKSARYAYDADAIAEDAISGLDMGVLRSRVRTDGEFVTWHAPSIQKRQDAGIDSRIAGDGRRNKRTVWTIATEPYAAAHFATMPTALVEPCILAGCPVGGVVLDPFVGSGTVILEALRHGRRAIGFDLSSAYCDLARARVEGDCPMFNREVPA